MTQFVHKSLINYSGSGIKKVKPPKKRIYSPDNPDFKVTLPRKNSLSSHS